MLEITHGLAKILQDKLQKGLGISCFYGAVIGDKEFILYYSDEKGEKIFLAHRSEFDFNGVLIRKKK